MCEGKKKQKTKMMWEYSSHEKNRSRCCWSSSKCLRELRKKVKCVSSIDVKNLPWDCVFRLRHNRPWKTRPTAPILKTSISYKQSQKKNYSIKMMNLLLTGRKRKWTVGFIVIMFPLMAVYFCDVHRSGLNGVIL